MCYGERTKPIPTIKSPTAFVNSPLSESHQTAKSTSRPFDPFSSGDVTSRNINEHDDYLPTFPSQDIDDPKHGIETEFGDYGKPPKPAKEVESEVAMVKGFTSQKDFDRHHLTVHWTPRPVRTRHGE